MSWNISICAQHWEGDKYKGHPPVKYSKSTIHDDDDDNGDGEDIGGGDDVMAMTLQNMFIHIKILMISNYLETLILHFWHYLNWRLWWKKYLSAILAKLS